MFKALDNAQRLGSGAAKASGRLAAAFLLALTLVAFYEVIVRKMGHPTTWTFPVICLLQLGLIWFGLPYCQDRGGHVSVDLVTRLLPSRGQTLCRVLSACVSTLLCLVLVWQGGRMVLRSHANAIMTTGSIQIPACWVQTPLLIGSSLLFLLFLVQTAAGLSELFRGRTRGR